MFQCNLQTKFEWPKNTRKKRICRITESNGGHRSLEAGSTSSFRPRRDPCQVSTPFRDVFRRHVTSRKLADSPRSCSANTAHLCQSRWSRSRALRDGDVCVKISIIYTRNTLKTRKSKKSELPERFWTSCRCLTCNFIYIMNLLNQRIG